MAKTTPVMGVYRILNTVSGRIYIGSSNDVRRRLSNHRSNLRGNRHSNPMLQSDWDSFGESAFEFSTIETVGTLEEIRPCEQRLLDALRPFDPAIGYNRSPRTDSAGWEFTDAQRKRLSESLAGKPKSDDHRANIWANRVVTDEHRAHMSRVGKLGRGVPKTADHNRKNSEAQRGELNHSCKLTLTQCLEIKSRLDSGERGSRLARKFGVGIGTVSNIKNGKHWSSRTTAS